MTISIPSYPNIPSQVPQVPDPYNNALKLASLKNMMSEQNLRQQLAPLDVQEAQARAQLAQGNVKMQQLQLQSEQGMLEMYSDPEFRKAVTGSDAAQTNGLGFDPNAIFELASKHNVLLPQALQVTNDLVARSQKIAETQKAIAQKGEAETKIYEAGLKQLTSKIGPILDASVSKAPDMLADFKKQLISNPPKGIPQQDLALLYAADLEHLPAIATRIGLEQDLYDFHKGKAAAAEAGQKVIPEGGGLSPEAQQKITQDIAVATNPEIQAGKEAVSKAEGVARASTEQAFARGSNAALANVPSHLVAPATAAAEKAGADFAQAQSVSQRLQAMMEAAKRGNVVSYQLIPEEGALQVVTSQGVHRINFAEIANYGGGSAWQRLQGHIGKALTGKSIPDSVLGDMSEIQGIMQEGAQSKYENTLKGINATYGSSFKPVEMEIKKPKKEERPPIDSFNHP